MADTHVCTECGQTHAVSLSHKEHLNKMKLVMLRTATYYVMSTMSNDFMVRDIAKPEQFKTFNNFQKLRYHGLVTPARDAAGNRVKGRWLITRNGWAFMRGELELPRFVVIRDNKIIARSDERVTIRQIASGQYEIVTQFEYFDEDNRPVGLLPRRASSPAQLGLGI